MSIESKYSSREEAHKAGFFSRRHRDATKHMANRDDYASFRRQKKEAIEKRKEARANRSAKEQIALLHDRPGNSKREIARLENQA